MEQLTQERLNALHQEIEQQAAIDINNVRAEAQRKHEALTLVWKMLNGEIAARNETSDASLPKSSAVSSGVIFPTGRRVEEIIQEVGVETDITQPYLFDILRERYAEVRDRGARSVKGQLAAILKKLSDRGVIKVHRESQGINPTVYRKVVEGIED